MTRILAISILAILGIGSIVAIVFQANDVEDAAGNNTPLQADATVGQSDLDDAAPRVATSKTEPSASSEDQSSANQPSVVETPVTKIPAVEIETGPSLDAQLNAARLRLASSEAAVLTAQQDAKIRALQQQRDVATAAGELRLLQLDSKAYRQGEAARLRDDLVGSIELGRQRAILAKTRMDWSERLAEKGLVSQYGLVADRDAMQAAQEKLQVSTKTLKEFDTSAHQRQLAILERQVQLATTEVERIRRAGLVQQAKRKVGLAMRQAAQQLARVNLARLEKQESAKAGPIARETSTADGTDQRQLVRANIARRLAIRKVVAHGSVVEAGQVLVELDASRLQLDRQDHVDAQKLAKTELERIEEEITLVESQSELDRSQSELAVKAARLALVEYTEGKFPRQKQAVVEKIDSMQDEVEAAERRLKWSQRVQKKGYLTPIKLDEDQLALAEQQHALAQLQHEMRIIEEHTYARDLAALQSQVEQAEAENKRTKTLAAAELEKTLARREAAKATHRLHQAESARLAEAISNCRIVAATRGRVLHEAPQADSDSFVAPQVGTIVQPEQVILTLVPVAVAVD